MDKAKLEIATLLLFSLLSYTYGQSSCRTNGGKNPFKPCVFPFKYQGVTYRGCPVDPFDKTQRWCSTKVDSQGRHVEGQDEYGFCSKDCPKHVEKGSCKTVGGPAGRGKVCELPFEFQGVVYDACPVDLNDKTKRWCSTKVYPNGTHVSGQGEYGFCDLAACPILDSDRTSRVSDATGCKKSGESCRPVATCGQLFTRNEMNQKSCKQSDGSPGLCCPEIASGRRTKSGILEKSSRLGVRVFDLGFLPRQDVSRAASFGFTFSSNVSSIARRSGGVNTPGTAEYEHFRFQRQSKGVERLGRFAVGAMFTAKTLRSEITSLRENGLDNNELAFANADTANTFLQLECPTTPSCRADSPFRNIDGSCNNLNFPKFGMSFTPVQRVLPNDYADGLYLPRIASSGRQLPSGRAITNAVLSREEVPDPDFTSMLVAFGQFLDHDLDHIPFQRASDGEGIECCDEEGGFREDLSDEEKVFCFPIEIPPGDGVIRTPRNGRKPGCINLVRSVAAPNNDCQPGPLEQLNQITHWLDSSNVYGSLDEVASSLRTFRDGLLRTTLVNGEEFLPIDEEEVCRGSSGKCALAGDLRVNEQPTLGAMHILFVREHNRIARELLRLNPSYGDEKLYQESKRILNAEWQHIIYNEFLPVVLGRTYLKSFGLQPLTRGFSNDYRSDFNPSVTNPFAVAAFRIGHTLINSVIKTIVSVGRQLRGSINLSSVFSDGDILKRKGVFDAIMKGLTEQAVEAVDNNFATDVLDELFDDGETGFDLVAINIQRGRDHGINGYTEYRQICQVDGFRKARTFEDLAPVISRDRIKLLKKAYDDVDDIDLFIGMVMEAPVDDALVGPTFLCLIGDTFARAKKGDRFFYDLGGQAGSFTEAQLDQIRRTSLARIICDNSKTISEVQPLVMRQPSSSNPVTKCDSGLFLQGIPKVDLSVFRVEKQARLSNPDAVSFGR